MRVPDAGTCIGAHVSDIVCASVSALQMTAEDDLLSGQVDEDRPLDMNFPGARAGEKPSPRPVYRRATTTRYGKSSSLEWIDEPA